MTKLEEREGAQLLRSLIDPVLAKERGASRHARTPPNVPSRKIDNQSIQSPGIPVQSSKETCWRCPHVKHSPLGSDDAASLPVPGFLDGRTLTTFNHASSADPNRTRRPHSGQLYLLYNNWSPSQVDTQREVPVLSARRRPSRATMSAEENARGRFARFRAHFSRTRSSHRSDVPCESFFSVLPVM